MHNFGRKVILLTFKRSIITEANISDPVSLGGNCLQATNLSAYGGLNETQLKCWSAHALLSLFDTLRPSMVCWVR